VLVRMVRVKYGKEVRMTWNYRIVKYKNPKHPEEAYGLHEVYYDEFKQPRAMTQDPMENHLYGETPEEIIKVLEMMLKDAKKPVLNEEDITGTKEFFDGE